MAINPPLPILALWETAPRQWAPADWALMYNALGQARMFYNWLKEEERADLCEKCGECEKLCPQGIAIAEWLEKAHQLLGQVTEA